MADPAVGHQNRGDMSVLFDETIAAVATAPGRGAVALLRVSGGDAGEMLLRVAPGLDVLPPPRTQVLAALAHPSSGEILDRALVTWFPAPASFTGENTVEISTHGGSLTPQLVLDALLSAGCRAARPGEFTQRALLNGKLDLLQAEATLDLIESRSRALHRAAVHQLDRGLSRRVNDLREAVLHVEALAIYSIDFPEEDEPPIPLATIRSEAAAVRDRISNLLSTARYGALLREGALVVLSGAPNSGKSSLFNSLLAQERAIVTEVPGTTRDAIEAFAEFGGYPFRLVDTAGLRSTADRVEEIGIEVAQRYLGAADLVIFCVPAGRPLTAEEEGFFRKIDPERMITVRTMVDLQPEALRGGRTRDISASVITGEGVAELRDELARRAFDEIVLDTDGSPLVTRERHARALTQAADELEDFCGAVDRGDPIDVASTHLRTAAVMLEEIVGVLSPDDVLDHLFSQFCVGK